MKQVLSFLVFAQFNAFVIAGEPQLPEPIARMTAEEQIRIVISYVDEGFPFPSGSITVDGAHFERGSLVAHIMRARSESLIPMITERIKLERRKDKPSKVLVLTLATLISTAGTEQSLETMVRLFSSDAALLRAEVTSVLSEALDVDWKRGFTVLYKAHESKESSVRLAAGDVSRGTFGAGPSSQEIWDAWVDALLLRHKRYPSDVEMRDDPIVVAVEGRSMSVAYDIRRRIVERANELRSLRQKGEAK